MHVELEIPHQAPARDVVGAHRGPDAVHGHGFGVIWDGVGLIHDDPAYRIYATEKQPEVAAKLGDWRAKLYMGHWNAGIFPNCSYLYGTNTFKVWNPRGPNEIEVWTWTLVEKAMSPELKRFLEGTKKHPRLKKISTK